ncbi:DENN domain-containing protein 10 isoform X1 [Pseudophryne corroboree]|uniref:DENN domain-containing protein 10 isoform X1 n=1 Tax=Pseudophryne corroboree TaxID=495146 RepID=UPI0030815073
MHGTGTIPGVSLAAVPLCLSVPPVHRAEQAASSGVGVREAPAQTRPRPRQEDGLCEAYSSDMAAAPGASEDAQLLLNVGLIEKDTNGEALWVWCYPYISAEFRELLLRKCRLREDKPRPLYSFLYGQYKRLWFYIMLTHVAGASVLHQVTHFCLALVAKDYNPEKYAAFSRTLSRVYIKNGSPVPMVESYISVLTKGVCQSEENGTFVSRDYDQLKAYTSGSIRDVVSQFGMETVILYTALMLKKRIAVFHPKLEVVQEFTRVLPALVWHRQDWSILHPYVHLIQEETEDLKTCPGYIAGFHNSDVSNRPDLYDVYVNLAESSISVSQSAKEALTLGKLHKEIGQVMVQATEDPDKSESQVIKDISVKTREILSILSSLAEVTRDGDWPAISLEQLKQRRLPPATENFLFQLAAAEQMLLT